MVGLASQSYVLLYTCLLVDRNLADGAWGVDERSTALVLWKHANRTDT
jgi:hypothetical protein